MILCIKFTLRIKVQSKACWKGVSKHKIPWILPTLASRPIDKTGPPWAWTQTPRQSKRSRLESTPRPPARAKPLEPSCRHHRLQWAKIISLFPKFLLRLPLERKIRWSCRSWRISIKFVDHTKLDTLQLWRPRWTILIEAATTNSILKFMRSKSTISNWSTMSPTSNRYP